MKMNYIKTFEESRYSITQEIEDIILDYEYGDINFDTAISELNKLNSINDVLLLSWKHYDIIKFCLKLGADPNYRKQSPLISWVTHNSPKRELDIIKILLKYGADINLYDSSVLYYTPLYYAIKETYKIDTIKYLLEHGAILYDGIIEEIMKYNKSDRSDKTDILELIKNDKQYILYLKKQKAKKFKL